MKNQYADPRQAALTGPEKPGYISAAAIGESTALALCESEDMIGLVDWGINIACIHHYPHAIGQLGQTYIGPLLLPRFPVARPGCVITFRPSETQIPIFEDLTRTVREAFERSGPTQLQSQTGQYLAVGIDTDSAKALQSIVQAVVPDTATFTDYDGGL